MTKTVTLYRQCDGWKGVKLEGVSVQCGHSRTTVDRRSQNGRRHLTLGETLEKKGRVVIPKAAIGEELTVNPGDILLFGEGPEALESPSQPKKNGWNYLRVQSVEDRRDDEILPHIAVIGC